MKNVLKPCSEKIPANKRALLLIDNYSGHINDDIENLLRNERIDVKKLPTNTTPYLQPMDLSVNSVFKQCYEEQWDNYQFNLKETDLTKKTKNYKPPTRENKVEWISKSWEKIKETTICNGF